MTRRSKGLYLTKKAPRVGLTTELRVLILERDNYTCQECGEVADDLEIDHIIPVRSGGKTIPTNLVTLCRKCNRRKGARIPRKQIVVSDIDCPQKKKNRVIQLFEYFDSKIIETERHIKQNETSREILKEMLLDHSLEEVMKAIDKSCKKHFYRDIQDRLAFKGIIIAFANTKTFLSKKGKN